MCIRDSICYDQVTAVDADSGNNNRIQYSLVSGDEYQQFFVDSETGQIYTAKSLDRETVSALIQNIKLAYKNNI